MLAELWRNSFVTNLFSLSESNTITIQQLCWNKQNNMNRNLKINTLWWHKFILVPRK